MKYIFPTLITAAAIAGCAGHTTNVQQVKMAEGKKLEKVCVVTNYSIQDSVEAAINNAVAAKGILSIPVNSLEMAKNMKCNAYIMYGGTYESDGGSFLSSLRIEVFINDQLAGRANASVPNNLTLSKYSAGEKVIPELINQLFP